MTQGCVFCDHDRLREADLYFENEFCIYASTRDPRDPPDVIPGCGGIVPRVHRASVFELTAEEWAGTRELLLLVRAELHKRLAPDSYTLGWNDNGLHPHLHVIPRFDDEPMANQGVRSGIKDPANRRPDPWRPGAGRHMGGNETISAVSCTRAPGTGRTAVRTFSAAVTSARTRSARDA